MAGDAGADLAGGLGLLLILLLYYCFIIYYYYSNCISIATTITITIITITITIGRRPRRPCSWRTRRSRTPRAARVTASSHAQTFTPHDR